jgi:hypothetical protein
MWAARLDPAAFNHVLHGTAGGQNPSIGISIICGNIVTHFWFGAAMHSGAWSIFGLKRFRISKGQLWSKGLAAAIASAPPICFGVQCLLMYFSSLGLSVKRSSKSPYHLIHLFLLSRGPGIHQGV